jgi:N-acetylneuraminic acid mutarotase
LVCQTGCKVPGFCRSVSALQWEQLPSISDKQGFAGAFAGVSGGALILAGGANITGNKWGSDFHKKWYDSAFVLERPDATWQSGFKLPHPLGYGVSITTGNGVICIGGSDADRHYADVFLLSWTNGTLSTMKLPSLPRPCANACGALLNGRIYVAGGLEAPSDTHCLKTFWSFDLTSPASHWEQLKPWPGPPRMLAVAGVHEGAFYLISGVELRADASGKPVRKYLRDAYAFTPGHGWRKLAPLPYAVAAAPSPAGDGNCLLIFSGDDGSKITEPPSPRHPGFPRRTLAYNQAADAWIARPGLPFSRATTPTVEWRGHLVVPMGEVRPRERTTEVWWAKLPARPSDRAKLK